MKNIIIFSGTTEGRTLSLLLADNKISHYVSVATEYGRKLCESSPYVSIKKGRMDEEEMYRFFEEKNIDLVIDATHPYAKEVTKNINEAAKKAGIKYMRYVRNIDESDDLQKNSKIRYFKTAEDCAKALNEIQGNILLTTGSKELSCFCQKEELRKRIIARVLPGLESIELCEKNGLLGKQIIAMQGPFSYDMNRIMMKQYNISCLVTKQSGRLGGFEDKYLAAVDEDAYIYIIGCPEVDEGNSLTEICDEIGINTKEDIERKQALDIRLIGCGMGNEEMLTVCARKNISEADIILGAKRWVDYFEARMEKRPYYTPGDIIPYLESISTFSVGEKDVKALDKKLKVAVLFSGDTGFYSGAAKLYEELKKAVNEKRINANISIVPGISSVSYLASKLNESWDEARIMSIHGRNDIDNWKSEIFDAVSTNKRTYILVSKTCDVKSIADLLKEKKLTACIIYAGYQLSYVEEEIIKINPGSDINDLKEGLYTCLILNPSPSKPALNIYLKDEDFKRGRVPMTKEEVRSLSIAKLNLNSSSVVYDVGSGTGSIAVQIAGMSKNIKVYAIENNPEAVSLIKDNCKLFEAVNVSIYEGEAPYIFEELPMPTHAFIGGSKGKLMDILTRLYEKNPHMRIVINAISTETLKKCMEIEKIFKVEDFSLIQLGVTRTECIGEHHLLRAENPVWICSFSFNKE